MSAMLTLTIFLSGYIGATLGWLGYNAWKNDFDSAWKIAAMFIGGAAATIFAASLAIKLMS
jgi:hypothetical protein